MLTYEDCIALSGLTKREIDAIAEHEHIPAMIAAQLASYLCRNAEGECCVGRFILDDIATAEARGDTHHVLILKSVLKHFVETHPRATPTA